MNRTSLLHALDHATALGPDEERELEQLAQAFPYCQTAHLLLAKIAHDRGTMLAGQRLRRAATYAADRALLRRLIEQVPEAVEPAPELPALPAERPATPRPEAAPAAREQPAEEAPVATEAPAPPGSAAVAAVSTEPAASEAQPTTISQPPAAAPAPAPPTAASAPILASTVPAEVPAPVIQPEATTPDAPTEVVSEAETPAAPVAELAETPLLTTQPKASEIVASQPVTPPATDEPASEIALPTSSSAADNVETPVVAIVPEALAGLAGTSAGELEATKIPIGQPVALDATPIAEEVAPDAAEVFTAVLPAEDFAADEEVAAEPTQQEAAVFTEAELPATAPPIRPPDELGVARFEFGLQPEPPAPAPAYELPLIDEWAAAATTLALVGKAPATTAPPKMEATPPPARTETAFLGDDSVGYSLAGGSRLGYGLGLLEQAMLAKLDLANEAQPEAAAPEAAPEAPSTLTPTVACIVRAGPLAQPLPPAGAFFEPDVLLQAYWEAHRPPVPLVPSSLELVNNFLRRQPRLSRPAMLPPSPTAQADLSTRSTRTEPDLASESLAHILARQGKIARAVEIYERLMVKQPEKMAYFAAQIQQLQPPA